MSNLVSSESLKNSKVSTKSMSNLVTSEPLKNSEVSRIQLLAIEGPHYGEMFKFSSTCLLGSFSSKNSTSSRTTYINLSKDVTVLSSAHAKITLCNSKYGNVQSLRLLDLKKEMGIFIKGNRVLPGQHIQLFIGDKIQLGVTVLQVVKKP